MSIQFTGDLPATIYSGGELYAECSCQVEIIDMALHGVAEWPAIFKTTPEPVILVKIHATTEYGGTINFGMFWATTDLVRYDSPERGGTRAMMPFRSLGEHFFPTASIPIADVVCWETAVLDNPDARGLYSDWCLDNGWRERSDQLRGVGTGKLAEVP